MAVCPANRNAVRPSPANRSDALSSMMPCETDTARRPLDIFKAHHAGIEVRQQPGLFENQCRHRSQIVERRRISELRKRTRAPR